MKKKGKEGKVALRLLREEIPHQGKCLEERSKPGTQRSAAQLDNCTLCGGSQLPSKLLLGAQPRSSPAAGLGWELLAVVFFSGLSLSMDIQICMWKSEKWQDRPSMWQEGIQHEAAPPRPSQFALRTFSFCLLYFVLRQGTSGLWWLQMKFACMQQIIKHVSIHSCKQQLVIRQLLTPLRAFSAISLRVPLEQMSLQGRVLSSFPFVQTATRLSLNPATEL